MGTALGEDLRALSYARRLSRLKARGVALWDVVASARRRGSLDSAIRHERHNPVLELIRRTRVRAVVFNGRKAADVYRRGVGVYPPGVSFTTLPSSSPAHASITRSRKAAAWRRIAASLERR